MIKANDGFNLSFKDTGYKLLASPIFNFFLFVLRSISPFVMPPSSQFGFCNYNTLSPKVWISSLKRKDQGEIKFINYYMKNRNIKKE
jgi:hypothetical protein